MTKLPYSVYPPTFFCQLFFSTRVFVAKIQKPKADLSDARKDLKETQYNKWHSDQTEMLDRLSEEYAGLVSKQSRQLQKDGKFEKMIQGMTAS